MAQGTCSGCRETFGSESAFDMHRTGKFEEHGPVGASPRRCLSVEEMRERGMAQNNRGAWVTALREEGSFPVLQTATV